MRTGHLSGRLTPKGRTSQPNLPGIATAGGGFKAGAAGSKRYGSGQVAPNLGKVADRSGYMKRDIQAKAQKTALARRAGLTRA